MTVVKPNLGPHAKRAFNPLSFDKAVAQVRANPNLTFHTMGNSTPFVVTASIVIRGKHASELVLRFRLNQDWCDMAFARGELFFNPGIPMRELDLDTVRSPFFVPRLCSIFCMTPP